MQPTSWLPEEESARSHFIHSKIVSSNIRSDHSPTSRIPPFRYLPRNRSSLQRQSMTRTPDREARNYEWLNVNRRWSVYEDHCCFCRTLSGVCICLGTC